MEFVTLETAKKLKDYERGNRNTPKNKRLFNYNKG